MVDRILVLALCLAGFNIAIAQDSDKHLICKQVEDIFSSRNVVAEPPVAIRSRPGKRGLKGEVGGKGEIGPQGLQPIVNYEEIYQVIDEKIATEIKKLNARFEQLQAATTSTTVSTTSVTSVCDGFTYDKKCFKANFSKTETVDFEAARISCENVGMKLANIYSRRHFDLMRDYMLQLKTNKAYISLYLGMRRNQNTNAVLLSDNREAPTDLPWYPGYLSPDADRTKMLILFYYDENSSYFGIYNYRPSLTRHGAMCEEK